MMMSLLTESSARKHVTKTRKRTPLAVFRPELHRESHEGERERKQLSGWFLHIHCSEEGRDGRRSIKSD